MKRFIFFAIPSILLLSLLNSPQVDGYIGSLKAGARTAAKQKDSLYEKIEDAAAKRRIPPADARIDKVWKTIPGYNGLEVDIPASYKQMREIGEFNNKLLVYKQVRPEVHLKDLPPAPIYKGNPDKPMVSFAVNVAWGNEYLPDMLATLKKHNISATFFLEGNWVKKNPELTKMIADAGHELGNHSYSHPDMGRISKEQASEELKKTNKVIEAATGIRCKWFAPPSGSLGPETAAIAASQKLGTVMWTVDTIDWKKPSPETIVARISKAENGSIILMHPTEPTAKALERMITAIEKKHLMIAPISEMLAEERVGKIE